MRETSFDELDEVERHLNENKPLSDWFGIRVYEPEQRRRVDGEILWLLRRNPPAKLNNILTIVIYEGHALVIKDITKLAKTYACVHCRERFTQACHLQRHAQSCAQGKAVIDCPAERVEAPQTAFEKAFYPKHCASQESLRWLQREPSGGEFTSTTQHAGTVASDGLCGFLSTVTTMKRGRYFNTTAVTGTDAENVSRVIVIKSLPTMTKRAETGTLPL